MKYFQFKDPLTTLRLVLRGTQGVFAGIVLVLSSFVANWYNTESNISSPSQVNFLIFNAVWSFLSLVCIQLLPRFLSRVPKAYLAAPFDLTNALFWFAGPIALGAFLQQLFFCRGDPCHAAQASIAFGVFSFVLWSLSAALTGWEIVRARRSGAGFGARAGAGAGAGGPAGTGAMPPKEVAA